MSQTFGSKAQKRRKRESLPASAGLIVHGLCQDALSIVPMYARLHALGLESPRGESVRISGGNISNAPPEIAIESGQAESRRDYARWVVDELERAAKILSTVQQGLEVNVGPGPGYRQPQTLGSDALVTLDDFRSSVQNQQDRLRAGIE